MKSLKQYIEDSLNNTGCFDFTFEDYCLLHNINYVNEDCENRFINSLGKGFGLENYDEFQNCLYETLLSVEKPGKVISYLENHKKYSNYIKSIEKQLDRNKHYDKIRIYGEISSLLNDKHFISQCNFWNYSIIDKGNYIILSPNFTKDKTEEVYKNKYIYHICPKSVYERKIKNYGLMPKNRESSKRKKIICFYKRWK